MAVSPQSPVRALTARRVLVIEPDGDARGAIASTLTGAGYAVLTAASEERALHIVRTYGADLVLLDLNRPAAAHIAQRLHDDRAAALPVVGMVATAAGFATAQAFHTDAAITKPFDDDSLLALVELWLPGGSLPA